MRCAKCGAKIMYETVENGDDGIDYWACQECGYPTDEEFE